MIEKKCPLLRIARELNTDCRGKSCAFYDLFCYRIDRPKTNADRIRSMTDEELAEYFTPDYYDGPKFYCPVQPVIGEGECAMRSDCRQCLLDWLKEEGE